MTKSNQDAVSSDVGQASADDAADEDRPNAHSNDESNANVDKALENQEQHQELEQLEKLLDKEQSELTPDEVELREELIEKHRSSVKQGIESVVEVAQFSGPLPPPGVLAGYEQAMPGAAERIFRMAENEQNNRHRKDQRYQDFLDNDLRGSTTTQRIGQAAGTICSLGGLGLAFYAFSIGSSGPAVAIILAQIAALAAAFLVSRKRASGDQVDNGNES